MSRMLKKAPGCASLKASTYEAQYASPSRSLRPCRRSFLNILLKMGA
ncbi:MAG: hypothetical protein OJF52_002059 [Nitrospira sp.]|nr:MAG: hypothetical protein OJF52_002059 [Nitrospira sp.]